MDKRIKIIQGDITLLDVDAIVNAAKPSLLGGNGVAGAIHRVAGRQLLEECKKIRELPNRCNAGEVKLTNGYGLKAKYVVHTVGPKWTGGKKGEANILKKCYENVLELSVKNGFSTIAFPAISIGSYRYPIKEATKIALATIHNFLLKNTTLKEVTIVTFTQDVYKCYVGIYNSYNEKMKEPTNFFCKLFFGTGQSKILINTALGEQVSYIKKVWESDPLHSFGLMRLIRLILILFQFIFPSLYIRNFFGKRSWKARRVVIELQVILKILFPLILLNIRFPFIFKIISDIGIPLNSLKLILVLLVCYSLAETILYLLSLIFLGDIQNPSADRNRSITLILLNYIEVTLDYAVIYKLLTLITINDASKSRHILTSIESIYFSFVTSTTLGFGDYIPSSPYGQVVVILQCVTMVVFVVLILSYFISNLSKRKFIWEE
ncbi:hypothetical protein E4V42_07290 [Clostridium estertheticum]|uniref:Macro domain-containing protein n=1 Tax=Clostridium estertheticum TaxID=238834 RepID=A0A5N7ILQ3_9CLOT|nr:macro domain-containing protein [Clostridium estertheticum]MPQ31240.1 hypothetical protein [Clostridium estertheticum]MPQ61914.1 hypothetical protein [Clostridium estertheticum]